MRDFGDEHIGDTTFDEQSISERVDSNRKERPLDSSNIVIDYQTGDIPDLDNSFAIVNGKLAIQAMLHKVIVAEDEFRTGLECKECGGKGKVKSAVQRKDGDEILMKTCPECNGKGGLIVTPDSAKRRATTGRVVSIGGEVTIYKPGDYVMYTNHAGTLIEFKNSVVLRIMQDNEIIARLYSVQDMDYGQAAVL